MLQYSQIKLTCIILLCNNIQYQFCCACECSLASRGHCSFYWLFFFFFFSFLELFFSATETSYVNEKIFNCINVVVNSRSAITFYFPDCRCGCPPHPSLFLFFPSLHVSNGDFVGGLLDVVWIQISVCGDWPGFVIFFCKDPTKTTPLHYFFCLMSPWSRLSLSSEALVVLIMYCFFLYRKS